MCPGVPGYSVVGVRLATSDSTLQAQDMYFYKVSPGVPRSMHGIALLDKTQHTVPALGGFLLQGGTSVVEHGMGGAGCFRGWHGAEWDRNNYWLFVSCGYTTVGWHYRFGTLLVIPSRWLEIITSCAQ